MNYFYSAYLLNIKSEFPIPELVSLKEDNVVLDVIIHYGDVPQNLADPTAEGVLFQVTENQCLIQLDDVARYLIQNGNEIIVDVAPNALESDVRLFLLGPCVGALLHQRGILAFHAATIATKYGAVLFTGPSGAGKSTLLNTFLKRDYRMIADDITGVILDDARKPIVLPGFPRTKLWADAAQALNQDTSMLKPTRPGLQKYELLMESKFEAKVTPLHRIYRLTTNTQGELKLTRLQSIYNFRYILLNTYREQFLDGLAMRPQHFALVTEIARHTTMNVLSQPAYAYQFEQAADLIERDFES